MTRVTTAETVAALTALAAHRVDVVEIHRRFARMPELIRRPGGVCAMGDPHTCRVFGVTWWLADAAYAGYSICLTHSTVDGPLGPFARQFPLPHSASVPGPGKLPEQGIGLVLLPRTKEIVWVLSRGGSLIAKGFEPLVLQAHEGSSFDPGLEPGAWLNQLLLTHRPWAALITGEIGIDDTTSGRGRLTPLGIEVRTTYIDTPVDGYRNILRNERVRGALLGVAYVHCQGRVYTAPTPQLGEQISRDVALRLDPRTSQALSSGASVLAALITERDRRREEGA